MLLTGNWTNIVFVTLLIEVMWKVTFLKFVHAEGLREKNLEKVQTVDESDGQFWYFDEQDFSSIVYAIWFNTLINQPFQNEVTVVPLAIMGY